MRRVRIKRDVGNDGEVRVLGLDGPDRCLHQAAGIGALGAVEALLVHVDDREQRDGWNAKRHGFAEFFEQEVHALALDAGHRRHGFGATLTLEHENRIDKVAWAQPGFCDKAAQICCPATAPHANLRELTGHLATHNLAI